jgi:hypothetical protein
MPSTLSLARQLAGLEHRLRACRAAQQALATLPRQPAQLMAQAGLVPDAWQDRVLGSASARVLLLCSRQAGKSTVAAALALHTALSQPQALVLLLSPTQRQSGELFRKARDLLEALRQPVSIEAASVTKLELTNGSRIVSLPGKEETVRGFSGVSLIVIDEAARVADGLYYAVRPMLAVSQGRLVALSTAFGMRGWFYEEWVGSGPWERVRVPAEQCPRISRGFLAEEQRSLGRRWYAQEYECSFEAVVGAVFDPADIAAAIRPDLEPLLLSSEFELRRRERRRRGPA